MSDGTAIDENISKLQEVKWRSILSIKVEEFSKLISDSDVYIKHFGISYIEKLTAKSKELQQQLTKLAIIYAVLMFPLFASQQISGKDFEVFGYGFKNLESYKEFLLFAASAITPFTAVIAAYKNYIDALVKECLKREVPDSKIRKYFQQTYVSDYMDGLSKGGYGENESWHSFTKFIMVFMGLSLIAIYFVLYLGSIFIQINVIYNVVIAVKPEDYLNWFIVIFAITSMLFSWLMVLAQIPLPIVDNSNHIKVYKLKSTAPEKYDEILRNVAMHSRKREEVSRLIFLASIYTITFTFFTMLLSPNSLDNLATFLFTAMFGAGVIIFLCNELIQITTKIIHRWFFSQYNEETPNYLMKFQRIQRLLLVFKVVLPIALTMHYVSSF